MTHKVLIVDDNEVDRELYRLWLKGEDIDFTEADSGETALKILKEGNDFDLIILDLNMNAMTGWEFLNHVPKYLEEFVVIISSGFVDIDMKIDLENRGATWVFDKNSIDEMLFKRTISALLKHGELHDEQS